LFSYPTEEIRYLNVTAREGNKKGIPKRLGDAFPYQTNKGVSGRLHHIHTSPYHLKQHFHSLVVVCRAESPHDITPFSYPSSRVSFNGTELDGESSTQSFCPATGGFGKTKTTNLYTFFRFCQHNFSMAFIPLCQKMSFNHESESSTACESV